MTYETRKGQQAEDVLFINGLQTICPYAAPLPFQGNMGQFQIIRMACTTACPHAQKTENEWIINCGSIPQKFNLTTQSVVHSL